MNRTYRLNVIFLAVLFFGFSFFCWIKPSEDSSATERRKLAQMPKLSVKALEDGTFMTDFEEYALDQFPFREDFRSMKAWVSQNIFQKADNNGIYVADGYAVKMEYPLKEEALDYAGRRFGNLYEKYLKDSSSKIYFSVIPDKNYFLAEKSGHLSMDYEKLFSTMQEKMPYAEYVDITEVLAAEAYYKTDVHWRQEKIIDAARLLAKAMDVEISGDYEINTLENDFYGVYFGQSGLALPGEELHYLTNEAIERCAIYNYENHQPSGIYDMEKAAGDDPYELFLSGSVSLLTIENPNTDTDRELVVFRDSFGSSLVPLLAEGYRKITLVDIRYIQSAFLENYVDFTDKDVLFLYSTVVLNNSETLK